jgi:hypothetical protein
LRDDDHKSLFLTWLDEHGSSVLKVARAYTLTSDECQDLAQEILLQAWRSLPQFEGKASAATWFYRVALHTAGAGKCNLPYPGSRIPRSAYSNRTAPRASSDSLRVSCGNAFSTASLTMSLVSRSYVSNTTTRLFGSGKDR